MTSWRGILGKAIKIGHLKYAIRPMVEAEAEGLNIRGICDHEAIEIRIAKHLPKDHAVATVLHEVLHAVWQLYDLPEKAEEEDAVTRLSHGLTAAMMDNPKFAAWFFANIKK